MRDLKRAIRENRFHRLDKIEERVLLVVSDIDGLASIYLGVAGDGLDEIAHVAKAAGLVAAAVKGERLAAHGLGEKIHDHAPVFGVHARPVGVENTHQAVAGLMPQVVRENDGLAEPFRLVVASAGAERIDVAPIAFGLTAIVSSERR